MLATLTQRIEAGHALTRAEAEAVMDELLSGSVATPEIARLLAAMRSRPYSVDELVGFARSMRQHARPVFGPDEPPIDNLVDTCGTGGDNSDTFNISTAAAIVAAAAGARVAKHGNRSVSSRSGSADVLEALGVNIDLPLQGAAIREIGIGFLFAQATHRSMRHASEARKQLGGRTIFNLLGPLTNPAGARAQVLGVFSADVMDLVAAALAELGVRRAFVVHGEGGLDEISLAGETQVAEIHNGTIRRYTVTPDDFGVGCASLESLRGGNPAENAALVRRIFSGDPGPPQDIVVINAAAALVAAGIAENFRDAARLAEDTILNGAAQAKLDALIDFVRRGHAAIP